MIAQTGYSVEPMGRMGEQPNRLVDYAIVVIAVIVVLVTIMQTVRLLVWPGESAPDHIKRLILDED